MKSNLKSYQIVFWNADGEDLDQHVIQWRSNNYIWDIIKYNMLTLFVWLICALVVKYTKFNEKDMMVVYGFGIFLLIGTIALLFSSLRINGWKEYLDASNNLVSFKEKVDAEAYVSNLVKNDNNIHKVKIATKTVV
jgi:small-conductance mechanosensitive channel